MQHGSMVSVMDVDLQPSCRKSLLALILRVLPSFFNSKTIHQDTQREGTNCCNSSMATARMETTRGPTYSMTRVIEATPWQKSKSFICRCHCWHCYFSPLTAEVTRHMDRPLQWPHPHTHTTHHTCTFHIQHASTHIHTYTHNTHHTCMYSTCTHHSHIYPPMHTHSQSHRHVEIQYLSLVAISSH